MTSIENYLSVKWLIIGGLLVHLVNGSSISCSSGTLSCRCRCSKVIEWDNALGKTQPHCHCDPACTKYQDCCADYRQFCGNQTSLSPSDPVFVCRRLNDGEPSIWLVETCPSSYKAKDILNKCQSNESLSADRITEQIPVTNLLNKIQYKNKYCAICNKVNDFFTFPFKIRIRCNILPPKNMNSSQTLDYMLKHCPIVNMELEKDTKRRFCYRTVNTCPINASKEDKDGCERGPAAVVYNTNTKQNFRNAHCMSCNGLNDTAICGPQNPNDIFQPKSFEIVMNFKRDDRFKTIHKEEVVVTCQKGYAYDSLLETCRRAISGPTKGISDKYRVNMWLSPLDGRKPQNFTHTDFIKELTTQFVDLLPSQIQVLKIKVEDRATRILFDLHARYIEPNDQKNDSLDAMQLSSILNFKKTFKIKVINRRWLVLKVTTRRLSCIKTETYPPGDYKFYHHNETVMVNSSGKQEYFTQKHYYLVKSTQSTTNITRFTLILCRSFFGVHCSHVMLAVKDKEYIIFKNKSLLFKPTGQQYSEGEYDMRNTTPWICTKNYSLTFASNETEVLTFNKTLVKSKLLPVNDIHTDIRRYMTIVGFTISVLCLFLVLLTHGILRDLRQPLPGKNLISLSLALFLAHLWYLFGSGDTDKPLFCQITSYILHFLFLASFGCTFIVAYDTRRTFSVKTAKAHAIGTTHQAKRLVVYILLSWGVPLILVVTCAVLDLLGVVTIGYRNKEACWMGNETALLVVFAAPVGSVLVYNVLAFTQTIHSIRSARMQTQRVKSSHYSRPATLKIYIRLVSLMGFSWFFGISAPLIHQALMYPFVFFTTLQGLYIFLAFVCKARVLRMIKAKLPLTNRKPARRPTKGTTTTTDSRTSMPYRKYPPPKDETQI